MPLEVWLMEMIAMMSRQELRNMLPAPHQIETVISLVGGGILTVCSEVFGPWEEYMTILLLAMLLDVISGVIVGINRGELDSMVAKLGITKKALMLVVVALVMVVDHLLVLDGIATKFIVYAYIFSEAVSVIENAGLAGVPVPEWIRTIIGRLNPDKPKRSMPT